MKLIKFALFGLTISLMACQSADNKQAGKVDSLVLVNTNKVVDERFLIIAGRSVGEISIGEDMEQVGKKLGRPNAGDAAMGKAWGIWFSNDSTGGHRNEIAVYSAYRDTSMRVKDVKQIRITSDQFKTKDGLTTGCTLNAMKSKFSDLVQVASYLNERNDTVSVYDSKKSGIGFEFSQKKSVALTVHPIGKSVNDTYLTLHPEWKLIN